MTVIPIDHPDTGTAEQRTQFVTAFADLAAFYTVNAGTPLPSPVLNIPVPPGPRGQRLDALDMIAASLGTVVTARQGCLIAERRFGPLVLEAHVRDEEASHGDLTAPNDQAEDGLTAMVDAVCGWSRNNVPFGSAA